MQVIEADIDGSGWMKVLTDGRQGLIPSTYAAISTTPQGAPMTSTLACPERALVESANDAAVRSLPALPGSLPTGAAPPRYTESRGESR